MNERAKPPGTRRLCSQLEHCGGHADSISGSRNRLKKRARLHAQGVRQFDDVDQPDVSFAAFDSADVVSMQVCQLRQSFLGKTALHPQFANAPAKQYARVLASHLKVYGAA